MTKDEILQKQKELDVLFSAWIAEKKKKEVLTYRRENGDLIEHHPNGFIRVIEYAQ
ncbi:hypothetical protein P9J82_10275 [Glaesserella parasuis]|uniref:Uncharacterized protein n=2 Tax=Glaesserella parasuis TaxID=738 RepID=A0AAJ6AIW8_GLAPU|nr:MULTISPECIES: hypothetical protein [Pasteurellaceae]AGO17112.1 hypothetical protein K756_10025 [Glaesserella parasuis ZJ0906]EQA12656.1 hypothetical protein HPSSW140_1152 [Glaesserella parasuis SW140]EQA95182.1 hypothetical protein HPS_1310 [Glaesserella parasuis 29755]EYE73195.1 hypothetical protein HPNK_00417 [Glaesserella parasuis str. Nagasaki]MCT8518352.1 hypothetical protein [Glaesserella parasuis]